MRRYLLRRLLLLPPTLFGILVIAFVITRLVPGGPLEQALAEKREALEQRGSQQMLSGASVSDTLSPEQTEQLKEFYGFDRPPVPAFFEWLGAWPRDLRNGGYAVFEPGDVGAKRLMLQAPAPKGKLTPFCFEVGVTLLPENRASVIVPATLEADIAAWAAKLPEADRAESERLVRMVLNPWRASIVLPESENPGWVARFSRFFVTDSARPEPGKPVRVRVSQRAFSGVLQGEFGVSFIHGRPVTELIRERLPISIWLGFWSVLLTYLVAIPLGVAKSVRHGGVFDNATSFLLFLLSSIPGYILAVVALFAFSFKLGWFAHSGFTSEGFADMGPVAKLGDLFYHTALPLLSMSAGGLAMLTMLMKNSLMDNLGADHVRTAVAKGVPFGRAVWRHAFRLSLVPVATGFGGIIGMMLTGNFLVEKIYDINGFGLLSYTSLVGRDYPVFLANLFFGSLLLLIGNVVSDICVALVDPRIRFDK